MARGLTKAGCNTAILDLRIEKAQRVENELKELGFQQVMSLSIDVTKKEEHVKSLKAICEKFGKVDILINGAGINAPTPFFHITFEEWNSVLHSQVTGTFLGCQVFGEHMVANGYGSIINITSASAGVPLSKAFYLFRR